jgi:CRP-like cAMP-binding protein
MDYNSIENIIQLNPFIFHLKKYKPKETLLTEGEVSEKIFFIKNGALRIWFNNEGVELTVDFFVENSFVSSFESFFQNIPSVFNIETIEESNIFELNKEDFLMLMNDNKKFGNFINETIYKRFGLLTKRLLSFIKDTPQMRYKNLLEQRPELLLRFPQHYIASYLGITSVSLSRIRNRK